MDPARGALLRVGLINVNGLLAGRGARAVRLAAQAALHKLDVVLITETHMQQAQEASAVDALATGAAAVQAAGWRLLSAPASPGDRCSGVAVLVRQALLQAGAVTLSDPQPLPATAQGRALAARLRWGGHDLQLLAAYPRPGGDSPTAAHHQFLREVLAPLHAAAAAGGAAPGEQLWGGDWNFVEDLGLDRARAPGEPAPAQRRPPGAAAFAQECPGLVDVYRRLHPEGRQWTLYRVHEQQLQASRLDRFYVSAGLLPYVARCRLASAAMLADHRLVMLDLVAREAPQRGPGIRRVRAHYAAHEDLRLRVAAFLSRQRAPEDPARLWDWWAAFKSAWMRVVRAANRDARRRAVAALAGQERATAAVEAAALALEAGRLDAAAAYAAAQAEYNRACQYHARVAARGRRMEWLHTRETPDPRISAMVRPPAAATAVTALRAPGDGSLETAPRSLPRLMAAHWAGVSAAPQCCPQARGAVLDALRARGQRLSAAQAAAVGSAAVLPGEVEAAIRRLRPGTASGPDGLPIDLYREHAALLAPLLAALYGGLGAAAAGGAPAPPAFLQGAIVFLYKKGDRTDPGNYRPITLLNADYRILTRALASRLGPALARVVAPEQTAFLPGRRMGETVWLLQLLPYLLRAQNQQACMVFLDFAKAYDTVDRAFLFEAMEAMGAGAGLLAWVRALLTDTQAVALVNGFSSPPATFAAGVRQGCPLSPLLYLFVAEALLAWLRHRGHGLTVDTPEGPLELVGGAYADDMVAVLRLDQARLAAFAPDMRVFTDATGQDVNAPKSRAMAVGVVGPRPPALAALPYPVVAEAQTLGVLFSNGPLPAARLAEFWEERLAGVYSRYERLARMQLSPFGRGYAATGYGLGRLLFHMEFMGLPPRRQLDALLRRTARLVDRGHVPGQGAQPVAVPNVGLPGPPAAGGFGLLPLVEHVRARHMWWAIKLALSAAEAPPWARVARALLRLYAPCASLPAVLFPCTQPLAANGQRLRPAARPAWPHVDLAQAAAPCPPLQRLLEAMHALPRACLVPGAPPLPAGALRDAPLCGNPFLADAQGRLLEDRFPWAFATWPMATVADAAGAATAPALGEAWSSVAAAQSQLRAALPPPLLQLGPGPLRTPAQVGAARLAAEAAVLARLQLMPHAAAARRTPWHLSSVPPVRVLTALQADPALAWRRQRMQATLDAVGPRACSLAALLGRVAGTWRLRWELSHMTTFWRVLVDGVPIFGSERFRPGDPLPCWCAQGPLGRAHCFWACPVAQAVRVSVAAALAPAGVAAHAWVRVEHLWLATPPPGVWHGPWRVVVLAALEAMDHGRRLFTARSLGAPPPTPQERRARLQRVCMAAVQKFWALLADFVAVHRREPPRGWRSERLPPGSPFMFMPLGGPFGLKLSPRPQAAEAEAVTALVLG